MTTASARSCSNIAFIKYWGNRDNGLRLPANGSISMNLQGVETLTTVLIGNHIQHDELILNDSPADMPATQRVSKHLEFIRRLSGSTKFAKVESANNFPTGAGIASSASGFAALTTAACAAYGLSLSESELSAIARVGSGSACRSIPAGYVEWFPGHSHETSFAETIFSQDHWKLVDCIAIVSNKHKVTGSSGGHELASSSLLQESRLEDGNRRLIDCRTAIASRDFAQFASLIELDALLMHSVMMTSSPPLIYWEPPTLSVMYYVLDSRRRGIETAFTIDAGANVHVICSASYHEAVERDLRQIPGVLDVLTAGPGAGTILVDTPLPAQPIAGANRRPI